MPSLPGPGRPACRGGCYAGDGDRCLALDLAEPSHRALLRADLDRAGRARLRVAPGPGDLGWTGGRPHEITIPLAETGPAVAPVRWRGEVTRRGHGHLPGCDGRLYLKLYAPRDLQDAVLTRHLPELAARVGGQASWWFIRYDDPEPHLRLRLTLGAREFGPAAEQAGAWTSELRDAGLISRVSWDTYYPESRAVRRHRGDGRGRGVLRRGLRRRSGAAHRIGGQGRPGLQRADRRQHGGHRRCGNRR